VKKPTGRVPSDGARRPPRPKLRLFDWSKYDPSQTRQGRNVRLADELVTYQDRLKDLLRDEGQFVLIKGREVIGIYESRDDAIKEAVARFRDSPVLVKQIVAREPVVDLGGAAS
jgi:hypothetical protein